ncbi:hypothetical protein OROMI_026506 [Orobanche minor]
MDSRSFFFFNLASLALFLLSHRALVASRDTFLPCEDDDLQSEGMCAAAVTIHGYKCLPSDNRQRLHFKHVENPVGPRRRQAEGAADGVLVVSINPF